VGFEDIVRLVAGRWKDVNPKDEARNPKQIQSTKDQIQNGGGKKDCMCWGMCLLYAELICSMTVFFGSR